MKTESEKFGTGIIGECVQALMLWILEKKSYFKGKRIHQLFYTHDFKIYTITSLSITFQKILKLKIKLNCGLLDTHLLHATPTLLNLSILYDSI